MTSILVTGGTGTLGRHVVPLLHEHGDEVTVVSRRPQTRDDGVRSVVADLGAATDVSALAATLDEIDVIVHLAGSGKGDDVKTRNLLAAVQAAGTRPHLVAMSVIGTDRTPVVSALDRAMFGYILAKQTSERLVEQAGLPWTVLRSTQFHEFVVQLAETTAKLPVVMLPGGTRIQPVDGHEVARRVIDLAFGAPAGTVELAGPEVHEMTTLVRGYLRSKGMRRPVVGVRIPGRAAAAFRNGANLSSTGDLGQRTWREFTAGLTATRR